MPDTARTRPQGLQFLLRALRHRNYRLFFSGQSVSLIGTWMTRVASMWLVYRLTNDALLLGVAGFAGQFPTFLVAPVAGVLIDRWNRHRVLVVTQCLSTVQSALLAVFALTGTITIVHIILLNIMQGLINAFDTPARQAFMVEMIEDRADLSNAIALNSSMVNMARLVGPSVAGLLIAAVGEGWCFLLDACSYVAVIGSLLAMRVAVRRRTPSGRRIGEELGEGLRYVAGSPPIRSVLMLLALVALFGMPYIVLMPMFAIHVLHGGAHTNGFLMSASGVGALIGALYLASRPSVAGLGKVIAAACLTFGAALIAFSWSPWMWLSMPILVVTGFAMIVQMAATNTIIQSLVDEDKRGRVMSFYAMSFFGAMPFGSLIAGSLAARWGAPTTVTIGGAVCILGGLAFLRILPGLHRHAHPILVDRGAIAD
jgi:MFS family permease